MKKGLMVYPINKHKIFNIGDYIQSLAAKQFYDRIDVFVDREHLNEYHGEKLALIANGWYMHNPENWPPSNDIDPLFVALHINKLAEENLLSEDSIKYLKQFEPIGCRDYYTVRNLKNKGVDAYFSGCMTLTLGNTYKRTEKEPGLIYFTDVNFSDGKSVKIILQCMINLLFKLPKILAIRKKKKQSRIESSFKNDVATYTMYSKIFTDDVLLKATYVQHEIRNRFNGDNEKFQYAEELLKAYAGAQYVVTSRIHCALPCLAMGVPVLFIYNNNRNEVHNCRLSGLVELFHLITITGNGITCDLAGGNKIDVDFLFENKSDYKKYADSLSERCRDFVKSKTQG